MNSRIAAVRVLFLCLLVRTRVAYGQTAQPFVLLPGSAAGKMIAHKGTWKPTPMEIVAREASLSKVSKLKSEGWTGGPKIDHPEAYFRQYVPIVSNGRKLIHINASCEG